MPNSLLSWVAATFGAHAIAANLSWYLLHARAERLPEWLRGPKARTCIAAGRVAVFVGVPYFALLEGAATTEQFGLGVPDPGTAAGASLPISLAAFVLVGLALWIFIRLARSRYPAHVFPAVRGRALLSQTWGASFVVLEALCLQAHWMFYRAGAIEWLGDANAGAAAGLVLVAAGWLLDPRWRNEIRRPGTGEDHLLVAALALTSALVFLAIGNFWVLLVVNVLLWLGWLQLLTGWSRPQAESDTEVTVPDSR